MNLEDAVEDIVGKAMRGLHISESGLIAATGITRLDLRDASVLQAIAPRLRLHAPALIAISRGTYTPVAGVVPEGLHMFTTPFGDITVNSFLIHDPATRMAAAFDTGSDCDDILETVDALGLTLGEVFLTHSDGDHIYDLDRLVEKTRARAWTSEPLAGAAKFEPGRKFEIGNLNVSTVLTFGHSERGVTYVIHGLARPIAVVGDALFAGSMGGGRVSYADAVRTTRDGILSLQTDTLICPGHGPLTTVGSELLHNPFFAR